MQHTLFIGSDHAGLVLKQHLLEALRGEYALTDCGPRTLDKHDDYPDYAKLVCEQVIAHDARGILICDTGIGMSVAANRYTDIRAALVTTPFMAERSSLHTNANILCLGQDVVSQSENEELVRIWLSTSFEAHERHIRRIQKLDMLG